MIANAFLPAAATGAATASRNRLGRRRTSKASARENGQRQQGKKGMQRKGRRGLQPEKIYLVGLR
jgi:hypothetical protein